LKVLLIRLVNMVFVINLIMTNMVKLKKMEQLY